MFVYCYLKVLENLLYGTKLFESAVGPCSSVLPLAEERRSKMWSLEPFPFMPESDPLSYIITVSRANI